MTITPTLSPSSAPSKRVLTEEAQNARTASRLPFNSGGNLISDDLTTRLQNIGSRVRKSVYDGYATQRLPLQSTYHVPDNTPNPSPVKPQTYAASTHSTPTRNNGTGIFRSASDTLAEVYGSSTPSPARSGRLHQTYSPSPSPCKKRSYTELDLDGDTEDEDDEPVDQDEDGDDAIMIILDKSDDNSAIESSTDISEKAKRPIKPLKKLTFGRSYSANDAESMPADVGKGKNQLAMDETWFSQPF